MPSYLIFTLTASLGSMGEFAGHERRGSGLWPGRSAVIGLMGAALGLRRDGDFSALDRLTIDLAVFDSGAPMRDFHTIESVPTAACKRPHSRREALAAARGKTQTTLTQRDYSTGVLYGVAVRGEGLERLATALNEPHFTLYLGRKSCPLAAPPGAKVVEADSLEEAFAALVIPPWREEKASLRYMVEEGGTGTVVSDVPRDRLRWHFSAREVGIRDVSHKVGGQS